MGKPTDVKTTKKTSDKDGLDSIQSMQLGVYDVYTLKEEGFKLSWRPHYERIRTSAAALARLFRDVYSLGPLVFILLQAIFIWNNVESVVLLSLESRILRIIEIGLSERQIDVRAILFAVAARLGFVVISATMENWKGLLDDIMQTRVRHYYDEMILLARIKKALPAMHDKTDDDVSGSNAWYALEQSLEAVGSLFGALSQLAFVFQFAHSGGHGPIFALLCIGKPLLKIILESELWGTARVVNASNEAYLRTRALKHMAKNDFKLDVVSGNMGEYIIQEYHKARERLGDISLQSPEFIFAKNQSRASSILIGVVGDTPMMYYVAVALLYPSSLSISTIAVLQQSSSLLRYTFRDLFWNYKYLNRQANNVRKIFDVEKEDKTLHDGGVPYSDCDAKDYPGMGFELQNISFSYPGVVKPALENVSLSIKPGSLVVIVGANGSGKSTIIKLLTRLYDASSGEILLDGRRINDYKLDDLRRSTASLTQDHKLFPLSIGENIMVGAGLGKPTWSSEDLSRINDAARKGGALSVIEKLDKGLDTQLDEQSIRYTSMIFGDPSAAVLQKMVDGMNKTTDVSGGERQRIVAARTFMRLQSDKVKFVVVDEPTSALDAEGERNLFDSLREVRKGKTMVFVTHRFGHLTVHADVILCMKDSHLIESGTHDELMALDGEYCKLYNIQAQAFTSSEKETN